MKLVRLYLDKNKNHDKIIFDHFPTVLFHKVFTGEFRWSFPAKMIND